MKRIICYISVLFLLVISAYSWETEGVIAGDFQRISDKMTINGINTAGNLSEIGIYIGSDSFKNKNDKIGFYFGDQILFPVGASYIANYQNLISKTFAGSFNILLGPSFRLINNDYFRMQLASLVNLGAELEFGSINEIQYVYTGMLFGFRANLDMSLVSSGRKSFGWGTSFSIQPAYKPYLKINGKEYDIKFDSYCRYLFSIYCGIHFHNEN